MGSEKLNKHILVGIKQEAMHPFSTKESVHSKTLYPQELARSKAKAAAKLKRTTPRANPSFEKRPQ